MTTHLDPELLAKALKRTGEFMVEEAEGRVTNYEIFLIDRGTDPELRAVAVAEFRLELAIENERVMRNIIAWLATNPQPGDGLDLRKPRALS
jgi:hypothetical protein